MTLRKTTFKTAAKDFQVLSPVVVSKKGISKTAFFAEFDFTPKPGFLYFTTRAISARVNRNFDGFPSSELKKYHQTFMGRPHFVNHSNHDPERARGDIVGSVYKENGKDKYIKLLIQMDANAFPRLANEIARGNLDGVSMGVDVGRTVCSFCNNIARAPEDFCEHVLYMKGQVLERPNADTGRKEAILVYETCFDLNFFEISSVFDPADETALVQEVMLPRLSHKKEAFGEATAPSRVDTLREKGSCPQCGNEDYDGDQCKWCGYIAPPDELDDPDLGKAQEFDKAERENPEDGPSEDDTDLDESTGSETPDDLDAGEGGIINPEDDQAEDFEGDPDDISGVGPGKNDASDGGATGDDGEPLSPIGEAVHDTIKNLEDLLELNQVVQQFAEDASPSAPEDPFAGADMQPAAPSPMDGMVPPPNDAMQDQIPPDAVPEAGTVPPDQSADAVAAEPAPDTGVTPTIPNEEVSPAPDAMGAGAPGEAPPEGGAPEGVPPSDEDVPPGAEDEAAPEEMSPGAEEGGEQPDLVDQVEDLADQVNQILEDLQGGDNGAGKEVSAMPTQAKTSPRTERANKIADAQKRLKDMQDKLADLSKNVAPHNGEETVGVTPAPEPATDSTESERDETRTNVQNLDDNPATREQTTKPDKRTNVEVPTVSIANKQGKARFTKRPLRTAKLSSKDVNAILARCDDKYAALDLGTALATVAREFANSRKVSAKNVLTQLLIAANKRASELTPKDRKSLATFSSAFVRQVKAADDEDKETAPASDTTTSSDDVLHYYDNGENLDIAKPDDRVDVEAPVANDTNDYAQSSQFDPGKYDHNAGEDIAKPDDVHTMNWAPGEKPRVSGSFKESSVQKASAVDAIKLAEAYIELGVFSPDLKFDKIAEFEKLPKVFIQQQQLTCDAVKRAQAANGTKPRGMVPRAATGHRPIPQMGRAATYSHNGSSASLEENLWAL